jgi:hypothetical protein
LLTTALDGDEFSASRRGSFALLGSVSDTHEIKGGVGVDVVEIEPRFLDRQARSLVTVLTELPRQCIRRFWQRREGKDGICWLAATPRIPSCDAVCGTEGKRQEASQSVLGSQGGRKEVACLSCVAA